MSTTTTDDQQLTNDDVKSSPKIHSTDNSNVDSSPIESTDNANEDLDLKEMLNELKNGNGNECSKAATNTATPRRFDFVVKQTEYPMFKYCKEKLHDPKSDMVNIVPPYTQMLRL
ncbi:hypothetical protein Tco_1472962 [Tanacetum coccineum]